MELKLNINTLIKKKVCIVGNLNIDLIIRNVPSLPVWGQEILGNDYMVASSGQSAYTGFALQKYGIPTSIIGNVGDDIYGDKILKDLKFSGINTDAVEKVKNGNTGITVAIVRPDGERAFVSDPSSLSSFTLDLIKRQQRAIVKADLICYVGIFFLPNLSVLDVGQSAREAQQAGKTTLLDTGWDPDNWQGQTKRDVRDILKYFNFFIPNMDESRALTGFDTPEEAAREFLNWGCNTVVIKLGGKGSYLRSQEEEYFVPAEKVKVFDAVGAGDTFNAGFILGTLQNWPSYACMKFGTVTSAQYISKPTDRFPSLDDSINFVHQTSNYRILIEE